MKRFTIAFGVLLIAQPAVAEILVQQENLSVGVPDVIPGQSRTIISLVSTDPNEIIYGVDAEFTGQLVQLHPLAMLTPFVPSNLFGWDYTRDSTFLFSWSNLAVPPLGVEDSDTRLSAALTNLPGSTGGDGSFVELAQIVQQDANFGTANQARYRLSVDVRNANGQNIGNPILTGLVGVPEPATLGLLMIVWTACLGIRIGGRRTR